MKVNVLAGFDLSYLSDREAIAGCVLFEWPSLKEITRVYCRADITFPYIPGLLSFREIPPLLKLWKKIKKKPDLIFVDGQGIAHPRSMGIATHLGILLGKPTIGIAKSRLVGTFREPGRQKGFRSHLRFKGKTVGSVLRTRSGTKPVFISPGHLIDLKHAVHWALAVSGKYRIPEPTRQADIFVNSLKNLQRQ